MTAYRIRNALRISSDGLKAGEYQAAKPKKSASKPRSSKANASKKTSAKK